MESKRNGEVPKSQVSSSDGISCSPNFLLFRHFFFFFFASRVVEKIVHEEPSAVLKLICKYFSFTVRLYSHKVPLKMVLKLYYTQP